MVRNDYTETSANCDIKNHTFLAPFSLVAFFVFWRTSSFDWWKQFQEIRHSGQLLVVSDGWFELVQADKTNQPEDAMRSGSGRLRLRVIDGRPHVTFDGGYVFIRNNTNFQSWTKTCVLKLQLIFNDFLAVRMRLTPVSVHCWTCTMVQLSEECNCANWQT